MNQIAVSPAPPPRKEEQADYQVVGLRIVGGDDDAAAHRVDRQQQRLAFRRRCENIAVSLAGSSPEERAAAYASRTYTSHELSTAAALRPDLMPVVNGEWEWIALTLADLD
ncbi:MAG: hypothetical protein JSU06_16515 [Actinobacteria bacterium]|nr:hypothetical protein [Actinomycetota bacterium]